MKGGIMLKIGRKSKTKASLPSTADRRSTSSRRHSCDIKYLGMGRCIDRRKSTRRKVDRFDPEAYEKLCKKNLGPGWLF